MKNLKFTNWIFIFSHCRTHKLQLEKTERKYTKKTKEIPCLKLTKEILKTKELEGQGIFGDLTPPIPVSKLSRKGIARYGGVSRTGPLSSGSAGLAALKEGQS